MPRTKPLNSKVNIKQSTAGDIQLLPVQYVTRKQAQVSTALQTLVNLNFAVDLNNHDNFFLIINGRVLVEGAGNDYQFTAIQPNNTSAQILLSSSLIAGLNILSFYVGGVVQVEPNVNSLQAQMSNLSNMVAMCTQDGTGQALTSAAVIQFNTKTYDPSNLITTGAAWKFTASVAGRYNFTWSIFATSMTDISTQGMDIYLRKNGVAVVRTPGRSVGVTGQISNGGAWSIRLNPGDTIDLYNPTAHAAGGVYASTVDTFFTGAWAGN